jgi:HAD superfamily hydrolase (TIGR01509 family)
MGDWVTLTIDRSQPPNKKLKNPLRLPFENRKLTADAVMFDLDGTLIDTVPIYYEIIDIVFAELGVPAVSRQTLIEAMDDGDFNWGHVLPDHMKKSRIELSKKASGIIDEIAPAMFHKQAKLIPGTDVIFKEIAGTGIKIGLVTSTPAQRMAVKLIPLSNAGLVHLLEVIVTADDVHHKKPSAEPLILCSQRLGVSPQKCVYVGDTRVDIRAGKAANMGTVGVLTGFDDYDALKNETPDAIINSIAQLSETLRMAPAPSRGHPHTPGSAGGR